MSGSALRQISDYILARRFNDARTLIQDVLSSAPAIISYRNLRSLICAHASNQTFFFAPESSDSLEAEANNIGNGE